MLQENGVMVTRPVYQAAFTAWHSKPSMIRHNLCEVKHSLSLWERGATFKNWTVQGEACSQLRRYLTCLESHLLCLVLLTMEAGAGEGSSMPETSWQCLETVYKRFAKSLCLNRTGDTKHLDFLLSIQTIHGYA